MLIAKSDWELAIRKVLKKRSEKEIPVGQACRKAAKKARRKTEADLEVLIAEANKFVKKASVKGTFIVRDGMLSLPPSSHQSTADTAAQPTEQEVAEEKRQRPKKRRKIVEEENVPPTNPKTTIAVSTEKASKPNLADIELEDEPKSEVEAKKAKRKKAEEGGDGDENCQDGHDGATELHTEIMPTIRGETDWLTSRGRKDIRHGRFSEAEKEALRQAARQFARLQGLDEKDFSWLYNTTKGDKKDLTHGAWKYIAAEGLPDRSVRSVWACGTRILHPSNYKGPWSKEETDKLLELVKEKGRRWKAIGEELDRLPLSCRDQHREVATHTEARKVGQWLAAESEKLQQAINEYLVMKQENEEKLASPKKATLSLEDLPEPAKDKPFEDARMLLDDIDWAWVAKKVGTRSRVQCMDRWYKRMAPSMTSQGEWGMGDDRRLLKGLLMSGARQIFLVPWEGLVKSRTAQQAKRRWSLMLKQVPDKNEKSFSEQLDYLVDTFAPGLRKKLEDQTQAQEGD